jgi:hypothetical protein
MRHIADRRLPLLAIDPTTIDNAALGRENCRVLAHFGDGTGVPKVTRSGKPLMGRRKRKLTAAEKAAKRRRREETMIIFVNGKQKRVRRPPTIEGMDVEEFIRRNADPIWLHENGMFE